MQNDAQARALEVCLQRLQAGEKLEQVLELYPQWYADLTRPLEAAQALRVYAGSQKVPLQTQAQSRALFLDTTQQFATSHSSAKRPGTARLVWLVLLLALIGLSLWIYPATRRALPGEILYPLKQVIWEIRLKTSSDPNKILQLTREFDQTRLEEIGSLIALGEVVDVSFAGLLQEDSTSAWRASGIPLELSKQTEVIGRIKNGIWIDVEGVLQDDGSVQVKQVRPHEIRLEGELDDLTTDTLILAGIPILFGNETMVHGSPLIGSQVAVTAFRTMDDRLLARLVDANVTR